MRERRAAVVVVLVERRARARRPTWRGSAVVLGQQGSAGAAASRRGSAQAALGPTLGPSWTDAASAAISHALTPTSWAGRRAPPRAPQHAPWLDGASRVRCSRCWVSGSTSRRRDASPTAGSSNCSCSARVRRARAGPTAAAARVEAVLATGSGWRLAPIEVDGRIELGAEPACAANCGVRRGGEAEGHRAETAQFAQPAQRGSETTASGCLIRVTTLSRSKCTAPQEGGAPAAPPRSTMLLRHQVDPLARHRAAADARRFEVSLHADAPLSSPPRAPATRPTTTTTAIRRRRRSPRAASGLAAAPNWLSTEGGRSSPALGDVTSRQPCDLPRRLRRRAAGAVVLARLPPRVPEGLGGASKSKNCPICRKLHYRQRRIFDGANSPRRVRDKGAGGVARLREPRGGEPLLRASSRASAASSPSASSVK